MNNPPMSDHIEAIRFVEDNFDKLNEHHLVFNDSENTDKDLAEAVEDEYGVLYSKDGKRLMRGNTNLHAYTIKSGTMAICYDAFGGCDSLVNINIPDTVIFIGSSAFCGCTSLKSIHIPDAVTAIGDSAFEACRSLESIRIPDAVTSIGDSAFAGCTSLTGMHIPE
ncbi:MAG: leucine-rich repeat domain-containing protein, partial [Bacteroidales bacterium]|nr:leucine-rich repeat domain-containing protein [Bacteroidales bacterium]